MAQSVEDFMRDLQGLGQRVGRMELHLLEVSGEIINDMIAKAPEDTGSLKNSMKRYVENHRLRFTMLYYGPFQNYGVIGASQNRGVKPVQFGVLPRPAQGDKYKFKNDPWPVGGKLSFGARWNIRKNGLAPKDFFDIDDMKQRIAQGVQERLDNLK
jgi:hypothetical protein